MRLDRRRNIVSQAWEGSESLWLVSNVVLFLVAPRVYLISASWLARIGRHNGPGLNVNGPMDHAMNHHHSTSRWQF